MLHDLLINLIDVLEDQSRALDRLRNAMADVRGAFASLGARRLQAGIDSLQEHSSRLTALEARRSKLVGQVRQTLQLDDAAPLSGIKAQLPDHLAAALQNAADNLSEAARRLRIECQIGSRLLDLSEVVNATIIESLLGLSRRDGGACYDCNAQPHSTDTVGGSLISGTV